MDLVLVSEAGEPPLLFDQGKNVLAVMLGERRLVVEQIDLRGPAGLEQVDDALGLGGMMGAAPGLCLGCLQISQSHAAQTGGAELQHAAAVDVGQR